MTDVAGHCCGYLLPSRPRARRRLGGRAGGIALTRSLATAARVSVVLVSVVLVSVAVASVAVASAGAASNGLWSVFPTTAPGQPPQAYLTPELTPGTATFGSVTVDNFTEAPLTVDLYAADAFNTSDGALSLRRQIDPQYGIGRWLHLATSLLVVPPRGAAAVPFVIVTPRNATPGDHVGGIVAEETTGTRARAGSVPITVLEAVGVRIYAQVRGPLRPKLSISHASMTLERPLASQFGGAVTATVRLRVRDAGNTVLTPRVRVSLRSPFGSTGRTVAATLPQLLPGAAVTPSLRIPGVLPYGHLQATVSVVAPSARARVTLSRWVAPWGLVAIVAVLVVVLVLAVVALVRRRHRARAHAGTPDDHGDHGGTAGPGTSEAAAVPR